MIDDRLLSRRYEVRRMGESDADAILELCRGNPQFYRYCGAEPSREQVLNDLTILPPGTDRTAKHYVGFYDKGALIAVMDLIDGYPEPGNAYIGFFMMDGRRQGRGIGSAIIAEAAAYLKDAGMRSIQLGIDKGNPQSTHFWKKNGFHVIRKVDRNGWTALVAERTL